MKAVVSNKSQFNRSQLRARAQRLVDQDIQFLFNDDFDSSDLAPEERERVQQLISEVRPAGPSAQPREDRYFPISERPLLSAEDESLLFRAMNFLKYRAHVLIGELNPKRPGQRRVMQAEEALDDAQRIRTRIAESNLRLVLSLARKSAGGRDFEDLVSDGLLILLAAIDKFDYARGFRFSTYATHAIRRFFYRQWTTRQRRQERFSTTPPDVINQMPQLQITDDEVKDVTVDAMFRRLFRNIDECLDDREQQIVSLRYGLGSVGPAQTLREVASELGISKERVRQLQIRALDKLRGRADDLFPGERINSDAPETPSVAPPHS